MSLTPAAKRNKERVLMELAYEEKQRRRREIEEANERLAEKQRTTLVHENFNANHVKPRRKSFDTFIKEAETSFLNMGLKYLLEQCIPQNAVDISRQEYEPFATNVIASLIEDCGGADRFIRRNARKSLFLAEFTDAVLEATNKTRKKNSKHNDDSYFVDMEDRKTFYDDLVKMNPKQAVANIQDRVMDAIIKFNQQNIDDKVDIQNIVTDIGEKIGDIRTKAAIKIKQNEFLHQSIDDSTDPNNPNNVGGEQPDQPMDNTGDSDRTGEDSDNDDMGGDDDTQQEAAAIKAAGLRQINTIKNRPHNIFYEMTRITTENIMRHKKDEWAQNFITESGIDFDKVTSNVAIVYTALEMANTFGFIDVDGDYINNALMEMKI